MGTAEWWAGESDYMAVVRLLLAHGADVCALDERECTVLHLACNPGCDVGVAEAILSSEEGRSTMEWRCRNGMHTTPLGYAVSSPCNMAVLRLLLASGADVCALGKDGQTVLHEACDMPANLEAVEAILSYEEGRSTLEWRNAHGYTPLHLAAMHGPAALVRILLAHGADVCARRQGDVCDSQWTVLQVACGERFGNVDTVEAILSSEEGRSTLEWRSEQGHTALQVAAIWGNSAVVRFLLARGADVCTRDEDGRTVLFSACDVGTDVDTVEAILSSEEGRSTLEWRQTRRGLTPLLVAATCGHSALVRLLMAHGADVHARGDKTNDHRDWTALHYACLKESNVATMEAILSSEDGRSLMEWGTEDGDSPLHLTADWESHPAAMRLLLVHGADVRAKNNFGLTPLQWVMEYGCAASVAELQGV